MDVREPLDQSAMIELWNSLKSGETDATSLEKSCSSTSSLFSSSVASTSAAVNWMIVNRGGIAKITGKLIVPSQIMGPKKGESVRIIEGAKNYSEACRYTIDRITIGELNALLITPNEWSEGDKSRCVVYNNPNGVTVAQFFETGSFSWTPRDIYDLNLCPVLLYDYRGVGLNSDAEESCSSSSRFHATYESVVEDGEALLNFALENYTHVAVWGSSLGGGVATASLERVLSRNPSDKDRVSLFNHDSFSKTGHVVMPTAHRTADILTSLLGANLDAETPMKSLLERGVAVTVLAHLNDPVIPDGARMIQFISKNGIFLNYRQITSDSYGHANLSQDMIVELKK